MCEQRISNLTPHGVVSIGGDSIECRLHFLRANGAYNPGEAANPRLCVYAHGVSFAYVAPVHLVVGEAHTDHRIGLATSPMPFVGGAVRFNRSAYEPLTDNARRCECRHDVGRGEECLTHRAKDSCLSQNGYGII